jgi:RNA polymerase sigma factor (sigma-70 family)
MEIEQLVNLAAMGDPRSFRALERRLQPKLREWLASNFPDLDHSDLVQNTLIVVWKKLPTFEMRDEARLMAWVFKIARFKALAALRDQEHQERAEAGAEPPKTSTGLSSRLRRAEHKAMVQREANKLPKSLRLAATNILAGGDTDELAKLANIKRSSALRQENRAIERLRERLRSKI